MTIEVIKPYLEAGSNVCPFAATSPIHYLLDTDDYLPAFNALASGEAIVIVRTDGWLALPPALGSDPVKQFVGWVYNTFIRAYILAVSQEHTLSPVETHDLVLEHLLPMLHPDSVIRPHIGLRGKALQAFSMGPVYPKTHPRYSPISILVLVYNDDVKKVGALPKVREAMQREHGLIYDANELVLTYPGKTSGVS